MFKKPPYTADQLSPAYQLRYVWTGWPSNGSFPYEPKPEIFENLASQWESDGIRLLEYSWTGDELLFLTSVKPDVSPALFTARMKGRLHYALRKSGTPAKFSRKLSMHTVGDACRATVEKYILKQVSKEPLADPKFKAFLEEFTVDCNEVDLSKPKKTRSGRYWYNLHLVLVTRKRSRLTDRQSLTVIRNTCFRIANKKDYRISTLSIMPDHLHVALGGNIEHSPEEIALAFMNNLAFVIGHAGLWKVSFYAGTFGEYDMGGARSGARTTRTLSSPHSFTRGARPRGSLPSNSTL